MGSTVGVGSRTTVDLASKSLFDAFSSRLRNINNANVRGEYKVWILRRYLIPSFHYKFAVERIRKREIKKLNGMTTKLVKQWLGLTRSTTTAVLHHPAVLDIPFLSDYSLKAKLNYLSSISLSEDPLIKEIASCSLSSSAIGSSGEMAATLQLAINSVESVNRKTLPRAIRQIVKQKSTDRWNEHLHQLMVQRKFKDACDLEDDNKVWHRIIDGLPAGQLSFILRAASDTLPTPLNLKRWKLITDARCDLCEHKNPTSSHNLNGCTVALEQGRYTWRHDSVLLKLMRGLLDEFDPNIKVYCDLEGFKASENPPATVPPSLVSTTARPDMVFIDGSKITLLELTIPHNLPESLRAAHIRKQSKVNYGCVLSDLERSGFTSDLVTLEIGSLGHWRFNLATQLASHLDLPKAVVKSVLDNAAKVSIAGSHQLFLARHDKHWAKHTLL